MLRALLPTQVLKEAHAKGLPVALSNPVTAAEATGLGTSGVHQGCQHLAQALSLFAR